MADEISTVIQSTDQSRAQEFAALKSTSTQPATKTFAINATGNLFVASTLNGGDAGLTAEAEKAFGQVSVFFAAMTKAIAGSENPKTGKRYSFYDYEAIDKIVSTSGLFIKVGQNDIDFKSNSWGVQFSVELIQAIFGNFTGGLEAIGKALLSMVTSIGSEGAGQINIGGSGSKLDSKIGSIIFVCEYLLGAVSISPVIVYIDLEKSKSAFEAGPCFKTDVTNTELTLHKETFLFVPPTFMEQAATMNEAMANEGFNTLVNNLKAELSGKKTTDDQNTNPGPGPGPSPSPKPLDPNK